MIHSYFANHSNSSRRTSFPSKPCLWPTRANFPHHCCRTCIILGAVTIFAGVFGFASDYNVASYVLHLGLVALAILGCASATLATFVNVRSRSSLSLFLPLVFSDSPRTRFASINQLLGQALQTSRLWLVLSRGTSTSGNLRHYNAFL